MSEPKNQKPLIIQSSGRGTRPMDELRIPTQPELWGALGRLAMAHTHLELILRYTVKTVAGLSVSEALDATEGARTSDVRRRIRKLFAQKKTAESEVLKLDALLNRARVLSDKRNDFLHSAWSETEKGEAVRKQEGDHRWVRAPSKEDVDAVTTKIMDLAGEINDARLNGFIDEVIKGKRLGKE
jgi:hypothetical protein